MKKFIKLTILFIFALFLFVSCEKEETPVNEKGTINLSFTATAPIEDIIVNVYVNILKIELLQGDTWINFEGFQGPQKFNMMDLTNGKFASLGSFEVNKGDYTKIRFQFDAPEMRTLGETGCSVELDLNYPNGSLYVPDESPEKWEAEGSFEVLPNKEVEITAIFNIRKSIFVLFDSPTNDVHILYPTFRLVNNSLCGYIAGSVNNIPTNGNIAIYAYKNGTYTAEESATPYEPTEVIFLNSISSSITNDNLSYILPLLPPMTYDLVITLVYQTGYFKKVIGIVEDVVVESSKTTDKPIDLISFQ